jgi:hypothetical protein
MCLLILILLIIKPLGISLIFQLLHLILIISLESLMYLVKALEMDAAHG